MHVGCNTITACFGKMYILQLVGSGGCWLSSGKTVYKEDVAPKTSYCFGCKQIASVTCSFYLQVLANY